MHKCAQLRHGDSAIVNPGLHRGEHSTVEDSATTRRIPFNTTRVSAPRAVCVAAQRAGLRIGALSATGTSAFCAALLPAAVSTRAAGASPCVCPCPCALRPGSAPGVMGSQGDGARALGAVKVGQGLEARTPGRGAGQARGVSGCVWHAHPVPATPSPSSKAPVCPQECVCPPADSEIGAVHSTTHFWQNLFRRPSAARTSSARRCSTHSLGDT